MRRPQGGLQWQPMPCWLASVSHAASCANAGALEVAIREAAISRYILNRFLEAKREAG